ncbi:abortive infection family protein [Photobacterium sp. SDRW27]|uniref:abortive infection family protein n=1 Tax=Photobacterium obscurum TaxID=2829490 RepID=UPI002244D70F|nr:abortive infection family protein [Photobacterium obscurum]MCW8331963.1 abortive infection family protein [Photobacterium obscurum]
MDSLKNLIEQHLPDFPDFDYYLPIIEKAVVNQEPHPDICIECCTSLIQGLSKTIISRLDPVEYEKKFNNKSKDTQDLVKPALKLLAEDMSNIEEDFIRKGTSLTIAISTLRNKRGDISHGKAVPKTLKSNMDLSRIVLEMTEPLLRFMLASFFRISYERLDISEIDIDEEADLDKINYNDNEEFNDYLDEEYPYNGKLLYSQALYELYYEDYLVQLEEYNDQLLDDEGKCV